MWSLKAITVKEAQERQEVLACRACLATGVVLYNIHDNSLGEDYVEIVGISLHDHYPQQLCCYCTALLQKCAAFRERCRKAYNSLMDISFSGKSMTIKNIQDIQMSHTELRIPYSLSGTEIIEICNEETVNEPTITDPPIDNNELKTEIEQDNDDSIDDNNDNSDIDYNDVDDIDLNINKNENNDIDMTIGDLIDANDEELQVIENKWMQGEYKIENLFQDVDCALEVLRQSGGGDEGDLKVFDGMPKWNEQHKLTDTDIMSLARMHDFKAVFPNKEEQIEEVEEMKKRRGIVCRQCGMVFKTNLRLNQHSQNLHDPTAKCVCKICNARFHYMFRLRYHILQHRVTYQCTLCDFKTKSHLDMPNHQSRHKSHGFVCEDCGKQFQRVGAMQKHVRQWHATSKPWCDLCGLAFVNQLGIETHMRIVHKDIQLVKCEKCCAEFVSEEALDKHAAFGCGEWSCKICGYVLGCGYLLKLHLLLLHNVPAYMKVPLTFDCIDCLVSFHSSKGFVNHQNTCGEGLHCVQCGEKAENGGLLAQHAARHDASGLTCAECGEFCRTVCSLQHHYYKVHKGGTERKYLPRKRKPKDGGAPRRKPALKYFKKHSSKVWGVVDGKLVARTPEGRPVSERAKNTCMCHVCGKAYVSEGHLKIHLRVHTGEDMLQCDHCPKQFLNKQALQIHMRCHDDEKPIKCPKCPMTMKSGLYKHMLTHSKEKRHVCQICGKTFRVSTSVKMHIKTVHMKMKLPPRVRNRSKKIEERSVRKNESD